MKRIIPTLAAVAVSSFVASAYENESAGQYWANERARSVQPASPFGVLPKRIAKGNDLPIILAVTRKKGIPDRLAASVCHIESRCRLNATGPMTRHGRHYGAYQIRGTSAARFGYRGGSLQGMAGLEYGAAHLADCWMRSGGNERRAAACHVGGPGMASGPRGKYANRYVQQVASASPAWAGSLQVAWR